MAIIKIQTITSLEDVMPSGRQTLVIAKSPEDFATIEATVKALSQGVPTRVLTLPEVRPVEAHQARKWFDNLLAVAEQDNDEGLLIFPPIEDVASATLLMAASEGGIRLITSIVATDVETALRSLQSYGFGHDELSSLQLYDLTTSRHRKFCRVLAEPQQAARAPVVRLASPMKLSLTDYIHRTREALTRRWQMTRDLPFAGITEIDDIKHLFRHRKADYRRIPGVKPETAFGIVTDLGLLEVWVHFSLNFKDYIPIFQVAARDVHGFHYYGGGKFHLDHAFSRNSAKQDGRANFVRLFPIEAQVNTSWNHVEKFLPHGIAGRRSKHILDWFIMSKLLGICAPTITHDRTIERGLRRIVEELVQANAINDHEREEALEGLEDLYRAVSRGVSIRSRAVD
ncbi:MAG: hypothetical protein ACJLUP_00860 [Agrobacterium tumefaciens]